MLIRFAPLPTFCPPLCRHAQAERRLAAAADHGPAPGQQLHPEGQLRLLLLAGTSQESAVLIPPAASLFAFLFCLGFCCRCATRTLFCVGLPGVPGGRLLDGDHRRPGRDAEPEPRRRDHHALERHQRLWRCAGPGPAALLPRFFLSDPSSACLPSRALLMSSMASSTAPLPIPLVGHAVPSVVLLPLPCVPGTMATFDVGWTYLNPKPWQDMTADFTVSPTAPLRTRAFLACLCSPTTHATDLCISFSRHLP